MNKATVLKIIGTVCAGIVASGANFLPEACREMAIEAAGRVLGWVHLQRPGDVKAITP